jgi:hypothetical protein
MNFGFSKHADREMACRGISRDIVEGVLAAPAHSPNTVSSCIITVTGDRPKALSCARHGNGTASPPTVVTVYRTSKIEKY